MSCVLLSDHMNVWILSSYMDLVLVGHDIELVIKG